MKTKITSKNKLLRDLIISLIAVAAMTFLASAGMNYWTNMNASRSTYEERLNESLNIFWNAFLLEFEKTNDERQSAELASRVFLTRIGKILVVKDAEGHLIFSNSTERALWEEELEHDEYENREFETFDYGDRDLMRVSGSFDLPSGQTRYVEVFSVVPDLKSVLAQSVQMSLVIAAFMFLIMLPFVWIYANRLLGPVKEIAEGLNQLEAKEPAEWRPLKRDEENHLLDEIIVAINDFISQAQTSIIYQENLARFLAHEIKTPLTHLLGEVEMIGWDNSHPNFSELQDRLSEDVMRIRAVVNGICDLSISNHKSKLEKTSNLRDVLKVIVEEFQRIYACKVDFVADELPYYPEFSVNPDYLWILLSNLLRNSIQHGRGREFPPRLRIRTLGKNLAIEVIDQGPGFPAHLLGEVNREKSRFQGYPRTGLVLCARICEIMGFSMHLGSFAGRGSIVRIEIPHIFSKLIGERELEDSLPLTSGA